MASQFCLPELHRYEFSKAPKSILLPTSHVLHRPFEHPPPDSWKKVPKEKEVEIDQAFELIFLPAVKNKGQLMFGLTKKAQNVQELGYKVYEHCSHIFDPVLVRKIPFNGCLVSLSCTKVLTRLQISARLLSGKEVFCKEYPLHEKVRISNLRSEIQREMIRHHSGSCNTTIRLVLEGQTSCLRGNSLIGLSSKQTRPTKKKTCVSRKI